MSSVQRSLLSIWRRRNIRNRSKNHPKSSKVETIWNQEREDPLPKQKQWENTRDSTTDCTIPEPGTYLLTKYTIEVIIVHSPHSRWASIEG